jgi:hypothetical protein
VNLNSTRECEKMKIPSKNIHVIQKNENTCKLMREKNNKIYIYNDMLENYMNELTRPFTIGFFDFMGGFNNIRFKTIERAIKLTPKSSKSILLTTFSLRNKKLNCKNLVDKFIKSLNEVSIFESIKVQLVLVYPYKRDKNSQMMIFFKIMIGNWPDVEIEYRPKKIIQYRENNRCVIQWWGYPINKKTIKYNQSEEDLEYFKSKFDIGEDGILYPKK